MHHRRSVSLASLAGVLVVAACSSPANLSGFNKDQEANATDPSGTGGFGGDNPSDPSKPSAACNPDPSQYDIAGDNCDNDNDGKVDNRASCDSASTGSTAEDFAKAIGLCESAAARGFGLVSAKFTRGYQRNDSPMAQQHGALPKFGNVLKPREGSRLGVLSTGYAQEYDGAAGEPFGGEAPGKDWFGARPGIGNGTAPPGFPKAASGCAQATDVNDLVDLHLELKAPRNATGFKFDFNFHSSEWPAYICSRFNDGFIAYLSAKGFNGGVADNMSFDSKKNPVSVNNGFFDRCTPNASIGCRGGSPGTSTCPGGAEELAGTGFGILGNYCGGGGQTVAGGATGWLSSQAAVTPGETFTLDLMIWDTGDGDLDSSVLLDNFQWIGGADVVTSTGRPTGPN
ncbi:MAG TPA: choice-of-anchor L domain-containing protein [Labilithrix sp.]|nr:choice-of-anchor L domain-containing protein [Labilithrix sp.]